MDTGEGRFEEIEEKKYDTLKKEVGDTGLFRVGEEVEIRGSKFRIKSIKPTELRLKLLPK